MRPTSLICWGDYGRRRSTESGSKTTAKTGRQEDQQERGIHHPCSDVPVGSYTTTVWQVFRMAIGTRRRYLRQDPRYELMLGTTFKSIGGYLDACCLRNADTDDGCAEWLKCRKWWDRKCDRTRPGLSEAEIVAIIAQFEEDRERWLERSSAPVSSHRRLPVSC